MTTMVGHLQKIGDACAVVLDKAIMEQIGLSANGEVTLSVENGAILVTPVSAGEGDSAEFETILDQIVIERRSALEQLAK